MGKGVCDCIPIKFKILSRMEMSCACDAQAGVQVIVAVNRTGDFAQEEPDVPGISNKSLSRHGP